MKRRAFLAAFAGTGFATTLLPGVLWAQMQQGTKVVTAEMVREAARLAGLELTDADAQDLTASLSSLARGAEGIDRRTLTNASPLPIHFDPRPHGVAIPPPPREPLFRIEAPPAGRRPASIDACAFLSISELAQLLRTRQITSTALTGMYLGRLKKHNAQLNCVAQLTEERALAEAAAADKEIAAGRYRGLLHGVPYAVKDIIAARGYPTRWGAKPLEAQMFDDDATVHTGRARRVSERRSELLHRVHRARRGVRVAGRAGPAQGRQPAHRALPARVRARDGRRLPAGQPASRGDHAGRRAAAQPGRRRDVHGADAEFGLEPQPGAEPDRPSVNRRAQWLCRGRHRRPR